MGHSPDCVKSAMGYFVVKSAVRLRGQGSHLNHHDYRTALTRRRAELKELEDTVAEAFRQTTQVKRIGIREGQMGESEWRRLTLSLLRQHILLLAMKHGRAPLPLSPAVCRGLLRRGVLNDVDALGSVARRFCFLGDERMLLAEIERGWAIVPSAQETLPRESQIAASELP
jgi:hypothetical protein